MERYLGIDIGGTSVKAALVSSEGAVLDSTAFPSGPLDAPDACAEFAERLTSFIGEEGVAACGIALPGVVADGRIAMIPNLALDLPLLLEALGEAFPGMPVSCLNDANAAALGELETGSAQGLDSFVFVTLGTGVGGAIVADGRLITGAGGAAGEIGHLKAFEGGRPCGCGGRGCLERYSSALGIVQTYREARAAYPQSLLSLAPDSTREEGRTEGEAAFAIGPGPAHDTDALAVFDAYEAGDPFATQAVISFSHALGRALAQLACILDPQAIVLGGGMSHSADLYLGFVRDAFEAACIPPVSGLEIRIASLGNSAGMIGAAAFARRELH